MFGRFSDEARRVIILAADEGRKLNHQVIDTHHLLLGLLREGDGVAARALTSLDVGYDAALVRVEAALGRGPESTPSHVPFTEAAKQAMKQSLTESLALGHNSIGPEHLLLGLVHDENDAARMLTDMGAEPSRVRERVIALLG
jgi:ATP-dependent Clp protease ATP-binding subunit ClpC